MNTGFRLTSTKVRRVKVVASAPSLCLFTRRDQTRPDATTRCVRRRREKYLLLLLSAQAQTDTVVASGYVWSRPVTGHRTTRTRPPSDPAAGPRLVAQRDPPEPIQPGRAGLEIPSPLVTTTIPSESRGFDD